MKRTKAICLLCNQFTKSKPIHRLEEEQEKTLEKGPKKCCLTFKQIYFDSNSCNDFYLTTSFFCSSNQQFVQISSCKRRMRTEECNCEIGQLVNALTKYKQPKKNQTKNH